IYLILLIVSTASCNNLASSQNAQNHPAESGHLNTDKNTIQSRYNPPVGFFRPKKPTGFHQYMVQLPLKPYGSKVSYFNGSIKEPKDIYNGVVAIPIGSKDLHQCADACMRLRADYLYHTRQ